MSGFLPMEALASLSPQAQALVSAMAPGAASAANRMDPEVVSGGGSFSQLVTNGLQQVNQRLISDQTDLQGLAMGNAENLHQIMIKLEESRVSFQLMMQVRNRALEAYQELMRMPL